MKTLSEHNRDVIEEIRKKDAGYVGVKCDQCGEEMIDGGFPAPTGPPIPGEVLRLKVYCPNCGYEGQMKDRYIIVKNW